MGIIISPGLTRGLWIGSKRGGNKKYLDPAEACFTYRQTAGGSSVGSGKAKITAIKGKSMVWNQLFNPPDSYTSNNVTITYSNGKATCGGVISNTNIRFCSSGFSGNTEGHKYLFTLRIVKDANSVLANAQFSLFNRNTGVAIVNGMSNILHENSDATKGKHFGIRGITNGSDLTGVEYYVMQIDLTLLFGAGNEPTTVAEFEALYPLPYYNYNAGTIINNKTAAIETRDANNSLLETLSINLATLTGKVDGTGSSVTICPDGLKSVGTVSDEGIVENGSLTKLQIKIGTRAYQSGDESDASVLTDGTNTNYVLDTPVTYVLDTPIKVEYREDALGTEKRLPEDTASAVNAPFSAMIAYPEA